MTLAIAAAATALGFLPGVLISRVLAPAILALLGIDAESVTAPWWMYPAVVAAGVGVPLLFSLASVLRASRTTVREALDERGVGRSGDGSASVSLQNARQHSEII